MHKTYPTDLTDNQWLKVAEFFQPARPTGGRPRTHEARELVNAVLYVMKEGCSWRALPNSFPPWKTVFSQRARWTADGSLERAMGALARASALRSASSTRLSWKRLTVEWVPLPADTSAPRA